MEASSAKVTTVIEPQRGWSFPNFRELWANRELFYMLARRDVVIRYKQAVIGVSWAVVQPVVFAAVFAVFFGVLQKVEAPDGIPYPVFAVTGMVMWLAFSAAVANAAQSTLMSESLISKVYFPRILIPMAAIMPPVVDFAVGLVVVVGVAAGYGIEPTLRILTVPFIFALAMLTALGAGLWLSALNVKYRDVHLAIPLALLIGLFISPIIYPLDTVQPEYLQTYYAINPMVGVLEAFRWAVLGTEWPGTLLLIPLASSAILIVTGTLYFQRAERTFADVI